VQACSVPRAAPARRPRPPPARPLTPDASFVRRNPPEFGSRLDQVRRFCAVHRRPADTRLARGAAASAVPPCASAPQGAGVGAGTAAAALDGEADGAPGARRAPGGAGDGRSELTRLQRPEGYAGPVHPCCEQPSGACALCGSTHVTHGAIDWGPAPRREPRAPTADGAAAEAEADVGGGPWAKSARDGALLAVRGTNEATSLPLGSWAGVDQDAADDGAEEQILWREW
jgi:hypothetical protein